MPRLSSYVRAADFEAVARRRLPRPLFEYIYGGADDEVSLRGNCEAFDKYRFVGRYLRDVRSINMSRRVLGCDLAFPLILAPTGMTRLFHPAGELGVATEAAKAGAGYALSTMGATSIEAMAAASPGPKIFQLYLLADDGLNRAIIERCREAGFDAICLTVDTIAAGNRERDLRTGLTIPPRFTPRSLLDFAAHPAWCAAYLTGEKFSLPNIATTETGNADVSTLSAYFAAKMERNITWARVEALITHWGGPFAIKGLQSAEDAILAAGFGAAAVMVSNHGGRQLDGAAATIDLVGDVVDAVGDRCEVILDGGVRRGSDIVKALAMGARACMIGRPYLYALAAEGPPGVGRLLELLRQETERTLALLGCASVDEVGRGHLRRAAALPEFLSAAAPPHLASP